MQADTAQCSGRRRDGQRCTSAIVLSSGFCFAHDPSGGRRFGPDSNAAARGRRPQLVCRSSCRRR